MTRATESAQTTRAAPVLRQGRWLLDVERSTASFSVRNFGLRTVRGTVPIDRATVDVDADGQVTSVQASLDLSGIDTGHARRDRDLAAPKLLDTGRHPALTFAGGPAEPTAAGWRVPGRIGARGAWTAVVLEVSLEHEAGSARAATVRATTRFDRRRLSIRAPRFLIGCVVGVEVRADLTAETDRGAGPTTRVAN